jgi:hypothetical protein
LHYIYLGQGNNMSIRKSVILKVGNFEEWLGPGSLGIVGGEDSDIIFRILKNKLPLMTNPKMIIYHNKWLTSWQERSLQCAYTYGLMAFLGYHLLTHGKTHPWKLVKLRISERLVLTIKQTFGFAKGLLKEVYFLFLEILAISSGLILGLGMSLKKHRFKNR